MIINLNNMRKFVVFLSLVALMVPSIYAQTSTAPQKLTENLYVVSGMGGNIAFLITPEGVLVVDSGNLPRDGETLVGYISQLTSKPIRYLVYTHCHGDHVGGAAGLPQNITIIAHSKIVDNLKNFNEVNIKNNIEKAYPERIAKLKQDLESTPATDTAGTKRLSEQYQRMLSNFEEYKRIRIRYPNITFTDAYTIQLANEKIDLLFRGAGHTNDNVVVAFRNHNVLHAGDLVFNGMVPFLFTAHGGTPSGWLSAVRQLASEGYEKVIPGHGAVGGNEILLAQAKFFESLIADVGQLKKEGKTLDEIKAMLNSTKYGLKGNEQQFPNSVEAAFNEL